MATEEQYGPATTEMMQTLGEVTAHLARRPTSATTDAKISYVLHVIGELVAVFATAISTVELEVVAHLGQHAVGDA